MRNAHGLEVLGSAGSSRPVDGEQQQEMSRPIVTTTQYVPDCKDLTAGSAGSSRPVDGEQQQETSRPIVTTTQYVPDCKDLTARAKEAMEENQSLQKKFSELQEKYRAAEEDRDCFKRKYEEKDEDNRELQKSITRLLIRCSKREKTIDGLREGLREVIGKSDRRIGKLQSEQMRLKQALRRELESNGRDIYTPCLKVNSMLASCLFVLYHKI